MPTKRNPTSKSWDTSVPEPTAASRKLADARGEKAPAAKKGKSAVKPVPEVSAKQQTEDDAKRVSSITEVAEKMKLTKDENTRAITAEKQRLAAADKITFAAAKVILTDKYKKTEIPALGLLAVGAVLYMFEKEKFYPICVVLPETISLGLEQV